MFFIFVLVFCLVFGDVVFAKDYPSNNLQFYSYTITYHTTRTINDLSNDFLTQFSSTIPMSDFTSELFKFSGSTDVVQGYYYLYNFYFLNYHFYIYDTDNTLLFSSDRIPNSTNGVAYFEVNPTHTVQLPYRSDTTPVVFHSSTWDNFAQSQLISNYSFGSVGGYAGKRAVFDYSYCITFGANFYATLGNVIDAIHQDNSDVTTAINQQTAQQQQYHDRDEADATSAKNKIIGVTDDLDTLQNKWSILWYPITFTNKILDVFTGQRARDSNDSYIIGYNYNDDTGGLEPVYDYSRSVRSSGASITFPSFTLPVLNLKLWDSYTYDLSQLPQQYPVLFNSIYVIVGVIELYWFVGFLSDKYHQIFGG